MAISEHVFAVFDMALAFEFATKRVTTDLSSNPEPVLTLW